MKKALLFSIPFLFLSISLTAQIKKGSILIGTDISFTSANNKQESPGYTYENSSNNFNISLLAGKAIKDNLFAGGALSFSTSKNKSTFSGGQDSEQKISSYGASAWMRKYFSIYGPLYAFVNGSLGGTVYQQDRTGFTNKENGWGVTVNLYPGISIQVKKSFYIDAALTNLANIYYNHSSSEQKDATGNITTYSNSNLGISTSLGSANSPLQLGVRWIIPAG